MFSGFTDETVRMLMDLKFHNYTSYFHENHDRYIKDVQQPFYELIQDLSETALAIDPQMEVRPHKCLSRIHRDTRFSKDKSPYRDHLWFLFRRKAEPREQSLNLFFEFGPDRLNWGMGFWGENRNAMDQFRRRMVAYPKQVLSVIHSMNMPSRHLSLDATYFKRLDIPKDIPNELVMWYPIRNMFICKEQVPYEAAFSSSLFTMIKEDYDTLEPLYRLLRGFCDTVISNGQE